MESAIIMVLSSVIVVFNGFIVLLSGVGEAMKSMAIHMEPMFPPENLICIKTPAEKNVSSAISIQNETCLKCENDEWHISGEKIITKIRPTAIGIVTHEKSQTNEMMFQTCPPLQAPSDHFSAKAARASSLPPSRRYR